MKKSCDCISYCGDDPSVQAGKALPCSSYIEPRHRGAVERFGAKMLCALRAGAPAPTLPPALKDLVRQADPVAVALYAAQLWQWEAGPTQDEAPAPLAFAGDGACAYVCFAANGNCIIWSTNQQQVADAAAKYGRPYIPLYGPKAGEVTSLAASDVLAERARQINEKGWTPDHDDKYRHDQLAAAASCYAHPARTPPGVCPTDWPWLSTHWKPTDRRSDLVKAAALILADIERLDRAAAKGGAQ